MTKDKAVSGLFIVFGIAIVIGGVYLYAKQKSKDNIADDIVFRATQLFKEKEPRTVAEISSDLLDARGALQAAKDRLNELYAKDAFLRAEGAVIGMADTLFDDDTSAPMLAVQTGNTKAEADVNAARDKVIDTLDAWKKLVDAREYGEDTLAAARRYAEEVARYLEQLKAVVNDLTPENSSLTQDEIDGYCQTVDAAANEAGRAVDELDGNIPADSDGGENTGIEDDIDEQEEVVDEAQGTVDELAGELEDVDTGGNAGNDGPAATSTVPGMTATTTPTPQIIFDDSGEPRLIEGTNMNY